MKRIIYFFRWLFCPKALRPYLAPDGTMPTHVYDFAKDFFWKDGHEVGHEEIFIHSASGGSVEVVGPDGISVLWPKGISRSVGYGKDLGDDQIKELSK